MQLIEKNVPANFNLFLFGDSHQGSSMFHEDGWNQLIDMMHSSYGGLPASANYGWDHGDMVEAIMVDDKRFHFDVHKQPFPRYQEEQAIILRKPIAKKLIGANIGNHEWKTLGFGNITEMVCNRLGIAYGTWSARITYRYKRDGSIMFKHFATHGHRTIKSIAKSADVRLANMRDMVREALKRKAGDCMLATCGHSHQLIIAEPVPELFLTDNTKRIKQIYTEPDYETNTISSYMRWYGNTGSFLKLYGDMGVTGYAERAGYDPVELGFLVCRVRNKKIEKIDKIAL